MIEINRFGAVWLLCIVGLFQFFSFASSAQEHLSVSVEPASSHIPANTLRLYLHFSGPMRRGQVNTHIFLEDSNGQEIVNPFLNLGTELWNNDQTRLTLFFDPGRIKQGVGPYVRHGSPLKEGETVFLVVRKGMASASAQALEQNLRTRFVIGPAERRAINPKDWSLNPPKERNGSLEVAFKRLMDTGVAKRLIRIREVSGKFVEGRVESDGHSWSFTPFEQWSENSYDLVVHPTVEDVSGNTAMMPFDKSAGSRVVNARPMSLRFQALAQPTH